jgi:hypothetical protein
MPKGTCSVPDCEKQARKLEWCQNHYYRSRMYGDPEGMPESRQGDCAQCGESFIKEIHTQKLCSDACRRHFHNRDGICSVEGCGSAVRGRGMCTRHYQRVRKAEREGQKPKKLTATCGIDGCDKPSKTRKLCSGHYMRFLKGRLEEDFRPLRTSQQGHITPEGYRMIVAPGHPNARADNGIAEHRFVMSEVLGRPLYPNENVHHINGDRLDNRPENLELWITRQPSGQRVTDRVADAVEILERYAPELLATMPVQLKVVS